MSKRQRRSGPSCWSSRIRESPTSSGEAPLVLASGSPYRRALLERLGVEFEAIPADLDESRRAGEGPDELAVRLARAKAEAVAAAREGSFVVGSDQVIALGDEFLTKPLTAERARRQLARLSGREHRLLTAVCVIGPDGRTRQSLTEYRMKMRTLSKAEIERYVDDDEPLDCAGSYRVEARGIGLFEYLRGDDYTAIVGLPLTRVRAHLDDLGFYGEAQ